MDHLDAQSLADPVKEARAYVATNYGRKLTLCEAAHAVHLSKNYFSFLFHKKTGLTFTQYVNHVRVERSKEFLHGTNLSIIEVMTQVGFEDQSYFTKVFRQNTGVSPRQYRINGRSADCQEASCPASD